MTPRVAHRSNATFGKTLRRGWRHALLALAFVLALAIPGLASASTGRPAGWQLERATAQVIVGRVILRYEPHLHDAAMSLAQRMPQMWSDIEVALAGDVDDRLQIAFVDHAGHVADATGMPRWVAGVARPSTGEIVIARHGPDGSRTDLDALLRHEMAHVVLHRATGGASLPRWFHEGVAESFEGGLSLRRAQTLANAVFGPGLPDMQRLEAYFHQADGPDAAVAYAAARDLVTFLRDYDGTGAKLRQVFTELKQGHNLETSFIRAYGLSLPELVGKWRAGLPGRFIWYPLIAGGGLPLALVAPLVVVAWIRRRRAIRRGYARLAREEALVRAQLGLEPHLA